MIALVATLAATVGFLAGVAWTAAIAPDFHVSDD